MKYILPFLLSFSLLIPSSSYSAVNVNRAYAVYNRIAAINGYKPKLMIVNSNEVNAYSYGPVIALPTGMLNFVRSDAELAMVLGHELGHSAGIGGGKNNELKADRYGAILISKAGYDMCSGAQVLKRLGKGGKTHPGGMQRYKNVGC